MEIIEKKDLRSLTTEEINQLVTESGEKPFRAKQINEWLWQKGARSIEQMSNLPKAFREKINKEYAIRSITKDLEQVSDDGTIKLRFKTFDGHFVEGVLIPTPHRMTACVSSQVGCSLSCTFCATGQMDRKRNLNFDEIFDQVVILNEVANTNYKIPLSNIVFMGMGEPLLNYNNVLAGIEKITSPHGLRMSPRRITVSTAGIAKMIKKLAEDKVRFRLALSLHAANDQKRNEIMPINESNNLETLIEAMNYFYKETGNRISFEYILFNNFNDSLDDAKQLLQICRKVPARVNLIEYNTVKNVDFIKSEDNRTQSFVDFLSRNNVTAKIRKSRGKDIDAACGQLANK